MVFAYIYIGKIKDKWELKQHNAHIHTPLPRIKARNIDLVAIPLHDLMHCVHNAWWLTSGKSTCNNIYISFEMLDRKALEVLSDICP